MSIENNQISKNKSFSSNNSSSNNSNTQTLNNNQIFIRQEVFDNLVYPFSIKLDENVIIQLFRKLHIMSSIDYKISLDNWIDQSLNFIQGLTEKEAIILFNTYKCISSDFEIQTNKKNDKNTVDVRYFGLFIALQCYSQKNKINTIDTLDKNAYSSSAYGNYNTNPIYNSSMYNSPLSSPRGKQNSLRNSNSNQVNDISNMINFVRTNIKLFLRLVATDIHNSETQLNSSEFNTLKFFFRINEENNTNKLNNQLSSSQTSTHSNSSIKSYNMQRTGLSGIAPFFLNFSPTTKVNIEKITDWISNVITSSQIDSDEHTVFLKNLSKCTTVKKDMSGKSVKIVSSEDSQIFIDSCVSNLKVVSCINCVIFVAGVTKITTIEKNESCNITVYSNFIKIGNTIDCKVNCSAFQEPVMYGNNIGLVIGPHNAYYEGFTETLKAAKFGIFEVEKKNDKKEKEVSYYNNLFSTPVVIMQNLSTSTSTSKLKNNYDILSPKDFAPLSTPFISKTSEPLIMTDKSFPLTPKEYLKEYIAKLDVFKNIQKLIKEAELDQNQEKVLHVAIQGHFKEWLINTNNVKNISDIVKVMDMGTLSKSENIS